MKQMECPKERCGFSREKITTQIFGIINSMLKETKYNHLALIISLGGLILFLFATYFSTVIPTLNGYPPPEIAWLFFYDTLINSVAALFISICLLTQL